LLGTEVKTLPVTYTMEERLSTSRSRRRSASSVSLPVVELDLKIRKKRGFVFIILFIFASILILSSVFWINFIGMSSIVHRNQLYIQDAFQALMVQRNQLYIQDALEALDNSKSVNYVTSTGNMNIVKFYNSKSWLLFGTTKVLNPVQTKANICYEGLINEKVGLRITNEEFEFVIKFIEENKVSTVLEYGGTGITTLKILQKVHSVISIEDDTTSCFRIANCIWSRGFDHEVDFFYHCAGKKYPNSPSEFSQHRDFIDAVENVHSLQKVENLDLVFVTGTARLACALKALKFMEPNSRLIFLTYPEPDLPDEHHANKLIHGYYRKLERVGRLLVMAPRPDLAGRNFTRQELHFLQYITYKEYASGKFSLVHRKKKSKKTFRHNIVIT